MKDPRKYLSNQNICSWHLYVLYYTEKCVVWDCNILSARKTFLKPAMWYCIKQYNREARNPPSSLCSFDLQPQDGITSLLAL